MEAFRGLDQLAHEQEQVLLELQDTQGALKALMRSMAEAKDTLSTQMNSHLQQVSTIQSTIRTLSQHLGFFKDATSDAWRHFEELEHLSSLPSSYAATLIEIQRRRLYGRTFSTTCDQMATTLESMRLVEMTARDAFLRQFGTHLPRDFVPGLAENPSFCEFHITTFDLHLPEIDAAVENAILSSSPSPSPSHAPLAIKDAKGSHAEAKDIRSSTSSLERTSLEEDLRMPSSQHSHTRDNMLLSDDPAVETATMATFNLQDMSSDTSLSESMSRGSLLLAANPGYRDPVQLQQRVMDLEGEVAQLRQALQASSIKETTTIKKVSTLRHCKLSFRSFHVDDLALFLPTSPSSRRTYLAFHLGCPHRYLSEESISPVLPSTSTDLSSSRETGKYQDFIVGKIVFIDKHVACREHNPYHLPLDTVFFTLMVTSYNISEGA